MILFPGTCCFLKHKKEAIIELDIFRSYKKGDILLKEGQYSSEGYFVIEGCVRCYYIIDGEEKTTAFYTEKEAFSPLCSVNKKPSEHFISCEEDTILVVSNPAMEQSIYARFLR